MAKSPVLITKACVRERRMEAEGRRGMRGMSKLRRELSFGPLFRLAEKIERSVQPCTGYTVLLD